MVTAVHLLSCVHGAAHSSVIKAPPLVRRYLTGISGADPLIAVLDDPASDLADREHYQKDWLGASFSRIGILIES